MSSSRLRGLAIGVDGDKAGLGRGGRLGEPATALWRVQDNGIAQPARRPPVLNTLNDIGLALEHLLAAHLPPLAQARPGMTRDRDADLHQSRARFSASRASPS